MSPSERVLPDQGKAQGLLVPIAEGGNAPSSRARAVHADHSLEACAAETHRAADPASGTRPCGAGGVDAPVGGVMRGTGAYARLRPSSLKRTVVEQGLPSGQRA